MKQFFLSLMGMVIALSVILLHAAYGRWELNKVKDPGHLGNACSGYH